VQPARPTRRQAESARRRQRIVEAARRCFGARGFAGATVEAIASEAGVSNGLLYQFFRNKEHLFEVVVDDLIRDWVRAMVGGREREGAGDALEAMLRRSVAFCRTHPLLPALLTRDHLLELARTSATPSTRRTRR
jgi:TetR/AcrR family transcriptional regulator